MADGLTKCIFSFQLNRGCQVWLKEAEWRNQKYTPTYNEYMEVAIISVGHILGILALFLGMGPNATKEGFEFVCQDPMPKLVEAAITIFRLMNDLASTKVHEKEILPSLILLLNQIH